jgi:hypothetical protein
MSDVGAPSSAAAGSARSAAYLSVAAKHSMHFFGAFPMLTEGQPWMSAAI